MAVALPCFCHITCVTEALLEDYKTLLALAAGEECHLLNPQHQSCANGERFQLSRVLYDQSFNHAFLTLK